MSIVCATHFTESSFSAVKVAAQLARKRREPLYLVNVQPDAVSPDPAVEQRAHDALRVAAAALIGDGLEVTTEVMRGPLGECVWRCCATHGAKLLVIGDSEHLTSALFASPVDELAYGTRVPVLVVRDEAPILEWARGEAPLKVMLALDRTWTSVMARDWIMRLAEYGAVDLVAFHLWWPADEYERHGLAQRTNEEGHDAMEALIKEEIEGALRALPTNVTHRLHLEIGQRHVGERLLALSAAEQVDVLVVGTHPGRGPFARLWSVSHDVLGLAQMSVVCVPGALRPTTVTAAS